VKREDGAPVHMFVFSLGPLRRILKDYLMMCDSYYAAVRDAHAGQIEAIDMGRRGVHNEGSTILRERLGRQDRGRFRHLAAAVHPDLRAAPGAPDVSAPEVVFVCTRNAVRSPMAEALWNSALRRGPGMILRGCAGQPGRTVS
jgi:hypothetical protein